MAGGHERPAFYARLGTRTRLFFWGVLVACKLQSTQASVYLSQQSRAMYP